MKKKKIGHILLLSVTGILISACKQTDTAFTNIPISRYDQDIREYIESDDTSYGSDFINKYDLFHSIYCAEILGTEKKDKYSIAQYINSDKFRFFYNAPDSLYNDISHIEKSVNMAFEVYREILPKDILPENICTHISGLKQQIINVDNVISISLDHYLGREFPYYSSVFHSYQLHRKDKKYIVPDILRVILYTRHPVDEDITPSLLNEMIYEGKVIYTLQQLLPHTPIEILSGFENKELEWCKTNENRMWNTIIQNKDLYTSHRVTIEKYMSPAPFTAPFSSLSPGQTGRYIGWRIVSTYMNNTSVDIQSLWETDDYMTILKKSKYNG